MKKIAPSKSHISVFQAPAPDHFFAKHPFVLPVAVFFLLFFTGLTLFVSLGGQTVGAADSRIVEVYYDGKNQTIPTRAKSVKELFNKLAIGIGPNDTVEPALDTPIVEDNFKINVYRARPIEVIDGTTKKVVQSSAKSARLVAKEAGLTLKKEDGANFVRPDEDLKGPLVAEKLIVSRSQPIQVSLYGVIGSYHTLAHTLGGFLEEKNILLKQGETTQPADLNTPITPGMLFTVNLQGKQVVSKTEDVAYATQKRTNPSLPAGQEKLVQEGVVGKRAVLYEVEVNEDGVEVARRPLQTVTLQEAVPEVREKGTLAAATYSVSADKAQYMAAAGIDPSQFASVDYIIQKESNWRPGAINSQGCIGLGQRCPSGGTNALVAACPQWQTDPVCQLRHFSAYANGRYGSWNAAYNVWVVQRWW